MNPALDITRKTQPEIASISSILSFRDKFTNRSLFILEHFLGRERVSPLFAAIRRRYKDRIAGTLAMHREVAGAPGRKIDVEARDDITAEQLVNEFAIPGRPVVLRGKASKWKAARWDLDFFSREYGDENVLLINHKGYGNADGAGSFEETNLRTVISNIRDKGDQYCRFHPLLDHHPELLNELDMDWVRQHMIGLPPNAYKFHNIFIGGAGQFTKMHNERAENLFVQIHGKKRWTLWPADYTYICEPEANRTIVKSSDLDPDSPDFDKYPAYRFADYYEVILEPGDILYLPAFMWHQVSNVTDSIGVGVRWMWPENGIRHDKIKSIMALFSANPSLFSIQRIMQKVGAYDFNRIMAARISHDQKKQQRKIQRR